MTAMGYNYNTADCAYQCGNSSCVKNLYVAYAALCAVCAFLLALNAIIINSDAIISVIICVAIIIAIIGIIIWNNSIRARDVYLS